MGNSWYVVTPLTGSVTPVTLVYLFPFPIISSLMDRLPFYAAIDRYRFSLPSASNDPQPAFLYSHFFFLLLVPLDGRGNTTKHCLCRAISNQVWTGFGKKSTVLPKRQILAKSKAYSGDSEWSLRKRVTAVGASSSLMHF